MDQIKNILVPLDFSESSYKGLAAACSLAEKIDARIHLVKFLLPDEADSALHPKEAVLGYRDTKFHREIRALEKEYQQKLQKTMSEVVKSELRGNAYIVTASVEGTIQQIISMNEIDLLVFGDNGERSLLEQMVGSTAEKMIRNSRIPVISVYGGGLELNHLLLATDLSITFPEEVYRFCKTVEQLGATIHLVNVITTELITEERVKAQLKLLAGNIGLTNPKFHILSASSETEGIIQTAAVLDADLILMKTYERSPFWSFFAGSVAEKTARKSEIPVMIESVETNQNA